MSSSSFPACGRRCCPIFPPDEKPPIVGFLIVEYIPHTEAIGYEVLIGFREDPAFGPALTVSKGGDDAEFFAAHYDPANLFLPPMEYAEALAFTRSLHIRYKFEQIGSPGVPGDDGARHGGAQQPGAPLFAAGREAPRT